MATVEPARALPVYQARYGELHNQLLVANIAIADLEQENTDLRTQVAELTEHLDQATRSSSM